MLFIKKIFRLGVLLQLFCVLAHAQTRDTPWAIIGAGPGGIIAVGTLLDQGVKPEAIVWIDEAFNAGRIGEHYHHVPSNTKAKWFLYYLQNCRSFDFDQYTSPCSLTTMDPVQTCLLSEIVQPLQWVTHNLQTKVRSIQAQVKSINKQNSGWQLVLDNQTIQANKVVLATGSQPKKLEHQGAVRITLDDALNPNKLRELVKPDDVVAVYGTSHSGILALKNLCDLPVKKIISYSKHPIRYAIDMKSYYIHDNTGLKGTAAQWARDVFVNNPPANLEKKSLNETDATNTSASYTKVIDAVGYERNPIPGLPDELLTSYDSQTGIISDGLFGIGIAFPNRVLDASGEYENAVGLRKFIVHAQNVVPQWIAQ
jgi:hypothetical protein